MSQIQPAYYNRVRFTLQHNTYGREIITEDMIEGWNDDEKEYARNKDYDGIFAKFSNNLRFVDQGKTYINNVRKLYGVNARIRLIKEEKDEEEKWVIRYTGLLDMSTWNTQDGAVQIKFNSSNLEKVMRTRNNSKIEINRTEDLYKGVLDPLIPQELELDGRRVFLDSKWEVPQAAVNNAFVSVETNAGNTRSSLVNIPVSIISKSHDNGASSIPQTIGTENNGSTGMMFFLNNDRPRILQIDLDFALDAYFQQYENVQWCFYKVCLTTYKDGVSYNLKERRDLATLDSGLPSGSDNALPRDRNFAYPSFYKSLAGSFSGEIELLENESLALELYLKSDMYVDVNAGVRVYAQNMVSNVRIQEDSYFEPTLTKGLLAHELFDRILSIVTGKRNILKSTFLGRTDIGYDADGPGSLTFNAHGHWIRRFSEDVDLFKPLTTSFKEAVESYQTAFNIAVGIESIGYGERVLIEDKKYFWNPNVTIRLGKENSDGEFEYYQISKAKRATAEKRYFSRIIIGSEKGGDYEEVMGLEETNTKSEFETCIDAVDETYSQICKYRFDPYGEEIIRRRGYETHPNTDSSGDLDVWMHDVKRGPGGIYKLRKWQEVLTSAPLLMFDPDSSYNFLFSPVNMLYNHGWVLNSGLQEYPFENIKYGSSTGNSSVSMQVIGRPLYAENGNIPNRDLQDARWINEEIEFEYEVDDEMIKQIEGSTTILGKKIPNVYGLVEFKNEDGELERGFILNLKPNKSGKWKLLIANR